MAFVGMGDLKVQRGPVSEWWNVGDGLSGTLDHSNHVMFTERTWTSSLTTLI